MEAVWFQKHHGTSPGDNLKPVFFSQVDCFRVKTPPGDRTVHPNVPDAEINAFLNHLPGCFCRRADHGGIYLVRNGMQIRITGNIVDLNCPGIDSIHRVSLISKFFIQAVGNLIWVGGIARDRNVFLGQEVGDSLPECIIHKKDLLLDNEFSNLVRIGNLLTQKQNQNYVVSLK